MGSRLTRLAARGRSLRALLLLALLQAAGTPAQPPQILQRGYDANVSGANLAETTLTTSNVLPGGFGMVFTLAVDDNIMAQPLYVPGVTINGSSHNVVYVATMSDSLYAFDADLGGAPLWKTNLATFENATPVPIAQFAYSGNMNLINNLGILSTPVIDPASNTLYAVACTLENNAIVYRLHAVDITSGVPRPGSGVLITGNYGSMAFNARNEWQRVSLVLSGNNVVFGFGALELESTGNLYSGWVMAYDKGTLLQTGIFATVTTGNGGAGVWQSGRPPVVDGSGYVYVFTGNGYNGLGYDGVHNFSESALKLDPAHGLALLDWFTPGNWANLDSGDTDLGSSGPLLLPGTSLLAGGGKAGVLYLLNTGGLGGETSNDSGALQEFTAASGSMRGGPVYWQRPSASGGPLLYDWGSKDQLKAFPFNGSTFATTPSAQGGVTEAFPGGILTLSANGSVPGSGVLWATVSTSGNSNANPPTPGALYAFDAGNVATQLWNSNMNPAHDAFGNFAKFVPPLVANGRVYVATWSQQVAVYGLMTATPTFSPAPGTYSGAQSVTLSDTTTGASIYYTTNGSTPTTRSTLYSPGNPITVSSSETIQAMAVASAYPNSVVASGAYVISAVSASEVSLVGSTNLDAIVNNGSAVPGTGIDGYRDAYSATLLGSSLVWNGNAFMFGAAGSADAVTSATIPLPAGAFSSLSLLATGVDGNQNSQVFTVSYSDGTSATFTQSLSDWHTPQSYPGESTVLTMAYRLTATGALDNRTFYLYGYSFALNPAKTPVSLTLPNNRHVVVLAVDLTPAAGVQQPAATPTFSPAPGAYSSAQSVTLSDTTTGASIYYTTNGSTPTTGSALYSPGTPIPVSASETLEAIAVASGYANSAVASGSYAINSPAATPTFSPAPGSYGSAQSVTLSDTTTGASIYYTTNGSTPTTSSTLYNPGTPIPVSSSETIQAIAVASGYATSAVASGAYVINGSSATEVSLVGSANVDGIVNNGSAVPGTGMDGYRDAYSATLLGTAFVWNGNTYMFGPAGTADAVTSATVPLPAGAFSTVSLLASGVDGNQTSQVFTVNYSDGTSATFTQSLSDWHTPQNYPGESTVVTMPYRLLPTGALDNRNFYLYGYAFSLNPAKTAVSLTLPNNHHVVVLAVDVN